LLAPSSQEVSCSGGEAATLANEQAQQHHHHSTCSELQAIAVVDLGDNSTCQGAMENNSTIHASSVEAHSETFCQLQVRKEELRGKAKLAGKAWEAAEAKMAVRSDCKGQLGAKASSTKQVGLLQIEKHLTKSQQSQATLKCKHEEEGLGDLGATQAKAAAIRAKAMACLAAAQVRRKDPKRLTVRQRRSAHLLVWVFCQPASPQTLTKTPLPPNLIKLLLPNRLGGQAAVAGSAPRLWGSPCPTVVGCSKG